MLTDVFPWLIIISVLIVVTSPGQSVEWPNITPSVIIVATSRWGLPSIGLLVLFLFLIGRRPV
jgi:hypothetical protein